jgi:hypothetical protein
MPKAIEDDAVALLFAVLTAAGGHLTIPASALQFVASLRMASYRSKYDDAGNLTLEFVTEGPVH